MSIQNPYQASNVDSETFESTEAAISKPRRPLSVWITMLLLGVAAVLVLAALFAGFYMGMAEDGFSLGSLPAKALAIVLLEMLIALILVGVLPFLAIRGIFRRTKSGRWMGLAGLLLLFAFAVLSNYMADKNASHQSRYNNDYERGGAAAAQILMVLAYGTLVYRFGFSQKSKAYFGLAEPESYY